MNLSNARGPHRVQRNGFFLALAIGLGLIVSAVLVWVTDQGSVWSRLQIDPFVGEKWKPTRQSHELPIFYQVPRVRTGHHFFRRGSGFERANILARAAKAFGFREHPYEDLPPVEVSYGRYGFRDEYPAVRGGVAVTGSSYVEAGFADASDTIVGRLNETHGLEAANFGTSWVGGLTLVHYLRTFILPTHPDEVVWLFSDRWDFRSLLQEHDRIHQEGKLPRPQLPGFVPFLTGSVTSFLGVASVEVKDATARWGADLLLTSPSAPVVENRPAPLVQVHYGGRTTGISTVASAGPKVVLPSQPILLSVLAEMKDETRHSGARLTVVYMPSRDLLFGLDPQDEPPIGLVVLHRQCASLEIPLIDLTSVLRQRLAAGELVVNPVCDLHLNTAGMRVAADSIASHLAR